MTKSSLARISKILFICVGAKEQLLKTSLLKKLVTALHIITRFFNHEKHTGSFSHHCRQVNDVLRAVLTDLC